MERRPRPLRPDRMRAIEHPFGWIPFRILTSGILAELTPTAKLLYFFLCLVADPQGLSYYGDRRLSFVLKLPQAALELARAELCSQDLLAFRAGVYQLLSLPEPGSERQRHTVPSAKFSVVRPETGCSSNASVREEG